VLAEGCQQRANGLGPVEIGFKKPGGLTVPLIQVRSRARENADEPELRAKDYGAHGQQLDPPAAADSTHHRADGPRPPHMGHPYGRRFAIVGHHFT